MPWHVPAIVTQVWLDRGIKQQTIPFVHHQIYLCSTFNNYRRNQESGPRGTYLYQELQLPVIKEMYLTSTALRHLWEKTNSGHGESRSQMTFSKVCGLNSTRHHPVAEASLTGNWPCNAKTWLDCRSFQKTFMEPFLCTNWFDGTCQTMAHRWYLGLQVFLTHGADVK